MIPYEDALKVVLALGSAIPLLVLKLKWLPPRERGLDEIFRFLLRR